MELEAAVALDVMYTLAEGLPMNPQKFLGQVQTALSLSANIP
jgi:hypothetical protein